MPAQNMYQQQPYMQNQFNQQTYPQNQFYPQQQVYQQNPVQQAPQQISLSGNEQVRMNQGAQGTEQTTAKDVRISFNVG